MRMTRHYIIAKLPLSEWEKRLINNCFLGVMDIYGWLLFIGDVVQLIGKVRRLSIRWALQGGRWRCKFDNSGRVCNRCRYLISQEKMENSNTCNQLNWTVFACGIGKVFCMFFRGLNLIKPIFIVGVALLVMGLMNLNQKKRKWMPASLNQS